VRYLLAQRETLTKVCVPKQIGVYRDLTMSLSTAWGLDCAVLPCGMAIEKRKRERQPVV